MMLGRPFRRRHVAAVTSGPRGFTLLEMLVTLVVTSMAMGLLWEAMQQLTRVERLLQNSGVESQLSLVRREWLRGLLESALPEQQNLQAQFRGDAQSLQLSSAEGFDLPGLAAGALRLSLHHDANARRNDLRAAPVPPADSSALFEPVATTLLSWEGPSTGFQYLDDKGQWLSQWPPGNAAQQRLPVALRLDMAAGAGGPLLVAITANEEARPRRADWERQ